LGLCEFLLYIDVMMIPGLHASKAYNLITDFGDIYVIILVFVAFCVLFSWRSLYFSRRDDDALKVVCILMKMMMLGECWLAWSTIQIQIQIRRQQLLFLFGILFKSCLYFNDDDDAG